MATRGSLSDIFTGRVTVEWQDFSEEVQLWIPFTTPFRGVSPLSSFYTPLPHATSTCIDHVLTFPRRRLCPLVLGDPPTIRLH